MDVMEKDPKALKKALTRLRNKRLFIKHMQMETIERENERAHEEEEMKMESFRQSYGGIDKETGDKLDYYRNKITGRKREAKERWNRFAGTGDSGGRGL